MALSLRTWPSRLLTRPWLLAFVPINASTAGFGVVLPLLILIPLHGSWADVALAATLFNSAVILSSFAWGHLSDRYHQRRLFLVINYAGYAVLYLFLVHVGSLTDLYAIYAVIGALSPAGASASNLLILEKFPESERANAFASFQAMSMIGSVIGLLIGYFWTLANDTLLTLLYVLGALALVSAAAIWYGISEARRALTTSHVAHHPESFASRLRAAAANHMIVPFFPRRPRFGDHPLRRFRAWARAELRHELPLLLLATFLFNLSANLYNISYTPYLYSAGLGASAIFLVNLGNNSAQMGVYPLSGGLAIRFGSDRLVHWATYVRSVGYLATAALPLLVLARSGEFSANLIIYAILGGAIAVYTVASSLMLFRGLAGRDAGSILGVNSALGGIAAVLGAALSGVLSVYGSYRLVFLVAGGVLLVSLPLWTAASVAYARRHLARETPVIAEPAPAPAPSRSVEPGSAAAKTP